MISFDREYHETEIVCDQCEESEIVPAMDFKDGVEEAKASGWIVQPDPAGGWLHFCGANCRAAYELGA